MESVKNRTKLDTLDLIDQQIVKYMAASGRKVDIDGDLIKRKDEETGRSVPVKEKVEDFARRLGVSRQTIYDRRNKIPNLFQLVEEESARMISKHMPAIYYAQAMKARGGDTNAAKFMAEQAELRKIPTQKQEVTIHNIDSALE